MDTDKNKNDQGDGSRISWLEYALAAALILGVIFGILLVLEPIQGNIFSNIARGLPRS